MAGAKRQVSRAVSWGLLFGILGGAGVLAYRAWDVSRVDCVGLSGEECVLMNDAGRTLSTLLAGASFGLVLVAAGYTLYLRSKKAT